MNPAVRYISADDMRYSLFQWMVAFFVNTIIFSAFNLIFRASFIDDFVILLFAATSTLAVILCVMGAIITYKQYRRSMK